MSKYFSKTYWLDADIQKIIGVLLRFGVLLSAAVAGIGGLIFLFGHWSEKAGLYSAYTGETLQYRSVVPVLKGAFQLHSYSIMQLGVLLLIATPIARVIFSFFAFLLEKDYLYSLITLIVLVIMAFSLSA